MAPIPAGRRPLPLRRSLAFSAISPTPRASPPSRLFLASRPTSPRLTTTAAAMKQWKSLVGRGAPLRRLRRALLLPAANVPVPLAAARGGAAEDKQHQQAAAVRLVGCDGWVRTYRRRVTARELMQQHPRHLICRSDALLIGEKILAVAPAEELQHGQAYFLLPAALGPRRVFS